MIEQSGARRDRMVALAHSGVRVVVGVLFACHGAASLVGGTVLFGAWPTWWVALAQLVVGVLVAVGLGTRTTALLGAAMMAYVCVAAHVPSPSPSRGDAEAAALYACVLLLFAALGAGRFAVDTLIRRHRRSNEIRRYFQTSAVMGVSISD